MPIEMNPGFLFQISQFNKLRQGRWQSRYEGWYGTQKREWEIQIFLGICEKSNLTRAKGRLKAS